MNIGGTAYVDKSVTLSAGQAAGTTAVLAEGYRTALRIQPPSDCKLTLTSGATTGMALIGSVPNDIAVGQCPRNQLFIYGLVAGNRVEIWEG